MPIKLREFTLPSKISSRFKFPQIHYLIFNMFCHYTGSFIPKSL
uniref:Uncharacterized protein n=1 Tax=Rhizophora mucronata TaxID=61149 RepID=A0A2P2P8A0_RHIMU